jgi:GTPase SAR1 family protein
LLINWAETTNNSGKRVVNDDYSVCFARFMNDLYDICETRQLLSFDNGSINEFRKLLRNGKYKKACDLMCENAKNMNVFNECVDEWIYEQTKPICEILFDIGVLRSVMCID